MNKRLRKGDQVIVITGNDRGKMGKILSKRGERFVVEGVNVRKKHLKKSQQQPKGQIIDIETPIHISNVRPCVEGKPVKLRIRFNAQGEKELYYLEDNREVLYRSVVKR